MSDLYEADILAWSEAQASLLRRLAAGERVNDQLDWSNLIEEVESVGNEQLHAVNSLLLQALVHMLKAEAWPQARDAEKWRSDARLYRSQATDRFAPSMGQRIDLGKLYQRALRILPETNDGQPPLPVPPSCPMTLDELLSDE